MALKVNNTVMVLPRSNDHIQKINQYISNAINYRIYSLYTCIMSNSIEREILLDKYTNQFFMTTTVVCVGVWAIFNYQNPSPSPQPNQLETQKEAIDKSSHNDPLVNLVKAGIIVGCGLIGGAVWTGRAIEFDEDYKRWKGKAIADEVYPKYEEWIRSVNDFDDYLCGLNLTLCRVAVRDPNGQLYDKEAIERWIDSVEADPNKRGTNLSCPQRKRVLKKSDLICDFTYHAKVLEIIDIKLKEKLDAQYRAGLLAYKNSTINDNKKLYEVMILEWSEKFRQNLITEDELAKGIKTIGEFYNIKLPLAPQEPSTIIAS
jgi:U-box domain-containing protein